MRVLILNSDYSDFLRKFYAREPSLENASYAVQMRRRNDSLFGLANFYSRNFQRHGHTAAEIHINNPWMQSAWGREHGMSASLNKAPREDNLLVSRLKYALRRHRSVLAPFARKIGFLQNMDAQSRDILLAQIEDFRPDIIFNQDIASITPATARLMQKKGRTLIAYCGTEPAKQTDLSMYAVTFSMLDWVINHFRANGFAAEKSHVGFEETVLDRVKSSPNRDIGVSFVGSLSSYHASRLTILERIAAQYPLAVWAPDVSMVPPNSILHRCYRGQAYGRELYEIMMRSKVSLNIHGEAARGEAANMRQFEATGAGSFLLTDNKIGLSDLFEQGREVEVYSSADDALEKIQFYLGNNSRREAVAHAGRARTLRSHTYYQRAAQIIRHIENYAR